MNVGAKATAHDAERGHRGREQQHLAVPDQVAEPRQERHHQRGHDQLRRLEPVDVGVADGEVVGDVAEDRRVVALQDPAGDLDADEEADDRGRGRARGVGRDVVVGRGHPASLSISRGYQRTPASEVVDADVLVVAVDALALGLGHPERREPVDPLADRGEEARVGGRHHHVRRGHGVREQLADRRRSSSSKAASSVGGDRARLVGVERRSTVIESSATALRTCSVAEATVSPTRIRRLTAARGARGDHVVCRASRRAWSPPSSYAPSRPAPGRPPAAPASAAAAAGAALAKSGRSGSGRVRRDPREHLDGRRRAARAGNGRFSSRTTARAIRAVGPPGAGVDECPPRPSARSSSVVVPFSETPMTPSGGCDPGEGLVRDGAALVEHEPRRDAARAELLDRRGRVRARHLLARAEGQPDVAGRHEVLGQQPLDGRADPDQRALVVERPAAPDRAVVDLGAEGRVLPRGATRRPARRRCGPSARPGRRRRRPSQWKSSEWSRDRGAASSCSCSSGNASASSRRGTPRTAPASVVGRVGVRDRRDPDQGLELRDGAVTLDRVDVGIGGAERGGWIGHGPTLLLAAVPRRRPGRRCAGSAGCGGGDPAEDVPGRREQSGIRDGRGGRFVDPDRASRWTGGVSPTPAMHDLVRRTPAARHRALGPGVLDAVADRDRADRGVLRRARRTPSRNASIRSGGMPKKQAPSPSSTAVCRISSAAIAGVDVPVGHRPAGLVAVGPALVGLGVAVEVGVLVGQRHDHHRRASACRRATRRCSVASRGRSAGSSRPRTGRRPRGCPAAGTPSPG